MSGDMDSKSEFLTRLHDSLVRLSEEREKNMGKLTTSFTHDQELQWEAAYEGSDLTGWGKTEAEAIDDLRAKLN